MRCRVPNSPAVTHCGSLGGCYTTWVLPSSVIEVKISAATTYFKILRCKRKKQIFLCIKYATENFGWIIKPWCLLCLSLESLLWPVTTDRKSPGGIPNNLFLPLLSPNVLEHLSAHIGILALQSPSPRRTMDFVQILQRIFIKTSLVMSSALLEGQPVEKDWLGALQKWVKVL